MVDGGHALVQACDKRAIGDYKVGVGMDKAACAALAERLLRLPEVERAVPVPPNVYITPALDALRASVVDGILDSRTTYGCSNRGVGQTVQVQFSCPNLNKALHLGHLRTNLMGMALAHVLAATGWHVIRSDQPSDWGRHIAKAVLGCQRTGWAEGKPDHVVQRFYASFRPGEDDDALAEVVAGLEAGDPALLAMNRAVTEAAFTGIRQTYARLGTAFDVTLREGDTIPLAKELIASQLGRACHRREDGSVYVDITDDGEHPATLLRADGSPLLHAYYLGASARRNQLAPGARFLFLMGREYADTFPDLVEVVRRFGMTDLADDTEAVYHGMVSVGTRKMSSRGGDAVDVDGLLDAVAARLRSSWSSDPFEDEVCEQLAVALVKYHFLRVPRMRDLVWDEGELWSKTLPRFALLVRTLSGPSDAFGSGSKGDDLRSLLLLLDSLPEAVEETVTRRDPSHLVRLADAVCDQARSVTPPAEVHEAVVVVLRRTLALLNVDLPPYLTHLPPLLKRGGPRAE